MAGQVNIGGNTASVQLTGNDAITADQEIGFPNTNGDSAVVIVTPTSQDIETTGDIDCGSITAAGNTTIGSTGGTYKLGVYGTGKPQARFQDSGGTGQITYFGNVNGETIIRSRNNANNGSIVFEGFNGTTGIEYARFKVDGSAKFANNLTISGNPDGDVSVPGRNAGTVGFYNRSGTTGNSPGELRWSGTSTSDSVISSIWVGNDRVGYASRTTDGISIQSGVDGAKWQLNADGKVHGNSFRIRRLDGGSMKEMAFMSYDAGGNAGKGELILINKGTAGDGSSTVGVKLGKSATSWASYSQRSLKTSLIPITDGLAKIGTLSAVTGRYRTDEEGVSRAFLIADEVKEVLPEAVSGAGTLKDPLSLRYTEVIPLLVSALHDAKDRIEALEAQLTEIKGGSN